MNQPKFEAVSGTITPVQAKISEEIPAEKIWEQLTSAQQDRLLQSLIRVCHHLAQSLSQKEVSDEQAKS